jgi:hypothetical protein
MAVPRCAAAGGFVTNQRSLHSPFDFVVADSNIAGTTFGRAWRETDEGEADRQTVIANLYERPLFRGQRRSAFDHAHENAIPAHEVMIKGAPDM